ncbi:hypothetical protein KXV77_009811, partial [Aspergillus fumigatus]
MAMADEASWPGMQTIHCVSGMGGSQRGLPGSLLPDLLPDLRGGLPGSLRGGLLPDLPADLRGGLR